MKSSLATNMNYAKFSCSLLICFTAVTLISGCRLPSVVETYEYHHRYDHMSDQFDPPVSLVHIAPEADLNLYTNLVIGHFNAGGQRIDDLEMASHYAGTFFRQVLAREIFETGLFYISLDPDYMSNSPTAVIEGKFTLFDTGWGLGRFLSATFFIFQSSSAVDLQVEGRIRDANTGHTIMDFADRRRFLGHTPWGPTLKTINETWAMKQTCIFTARSLASLLAHLHSGQEK